MRLVWSRSRNLQLVEISPGFGERSGRGAGRGILTSCLHHQRSAFTWCLAAKICRRVSSRQSRAVGAGARVRRVPRASPKHRRQHKLSLQSWQDGCAGKTLSGL